MTPDFSLIKDDLKALVEVDISSIESVYDTTVSNQTTQEVTSAHLYHVATGSLPQSKRKIYIIDKHGRVLRGHNKLSLRLANPMEFKNVRSWYPPLKEVRDGNYQTSGDPNFDDVYEVLSTIEPKTYFERCNGWKDVLDELFYQGFMKDPVLANAFKACMPPLPFEPRKWQKYNNHAFLFTQTKTGKTGFSETVLGQSVVTEPSAPGLAGGILGTQVRTGVLQGTGFCMLDEINATDTEVFDLILNLMENGVGNRGKVGLPTCTTTKTIMFCGNPEDDVPELLAMDFRLILGSLTKDGSNIERVANRLGLFIYGIDFTRATPTYNVDENVVDLVRNLVYDTFSVHSDKFTALLDKMRLPWLYKDDPEWVKRVKKLAPRAKDEKINQFIKGWADSVDNMRMAALRWAVLEHLDKFVLLPLDKFLADTDFQTELEANYTFVKDQINYPSLENLVTVELKTNYENFKRLLLSYPSLRYKPERELQRLFGVGSPNTISSWLKQIDSETLIEAHEDVEVENPFGIDEAELAAKESQEIQEQIRKEMDEAITSNPPPKKPHFHYQ